MDHVWLEDVYRRTMAKMQATVARLGERCPHTSRDGRYTEDMLEKDAYWWTNGFWPGMLWQMYHATGEEDCRAAATAAERRLAQTLTLYDGLHHDVGFMFHLSSVAGYRLCGDAQMRTHGRHAANLLAGRYNSLGQFIRAWENYDKNEDKSGWIIIDTMMNLPLLYWAAREDNDVRYDAVARSHARTALRQLLRPDGSSNHIAILNPRDGARLETPGGQGYAPGSSWTRGQAWALYGFALSARHTGEQDLLDAAKRMAHYFMAAAACTGFDVPADFRAPEEPFKSDATAAACAACGLLCLADQVGAHEAAMYRAGAVALLRVLDAKYGLWDAQTDALLTGGAGSYHDPNQPISIIYGDYFFLEAVLRLKGKAFDMW